jgi:serine/threonine-protein kinase OSR1/STK39
MPVLSRALHTLALQGANILIDQKGQVILADLGVTAQMRTDFKVDRLAAQPGTRAYLERTTFAGTPCWMAPEVMEEDVG